jgi:hypothetical protein
MYKGFIKLSVKVYLPNRLAQIYLSNEKHQQSPRQPKRYFSAQSRVIDASCIDVDEIVV